MSNQPFVLKINESFILEGYSEYTETKYEKMKSFFLTVDENRSDKELIYKVYKKDVLAEPGRLLQCITIIEPGTINGQFFMTRGHNHINTSCAEIYFGIKGDGCVLMQRDDEFVCESISKNKSVYIPGGWAHRTVNVSSSDPLVFYSIWPADSGYDYEYIVSNPFSYNVFESDSNKLYSLEKN